MAASAVMDASSVAVNDVFVVVSFVATNSIESERMIGVGLWSSHSGDRPNDS